VAYFHRSGPVGTITFLRLFFAPAILVACIIALTGDIYTKKKDESGKLITLSFGNRIVLAESRPWRSASSLALVRIISGVSEVKPELCMMGLCSGGQVALNPFSGQGEPESIDHRRERPTGHE
jgi:hypothetical protein